MQNVNVKSSIPQPASGPLTDVESALAAARELSFRAQALADRFLGAIPEVAGSPSAPTPDGLLYRMQSDAERTRSVVEDGARALLRIEQAAQ